MLTTNLAEIVLPYGTTTVTVGKIPALLAEALHPSAPEGVPRVLESLLKQDKSNPDSMALRLTDDDWNVLHGIWAGLPSYREGMHEWELQKYLEALESTEQEFGWRLVPVWRDDDLNNAIARIAAEAEHGKMLEKAVREGELLVRSPLTLAQESFPYGEQLKRAVVVIEDLEQYAARFKVGVRIAERSRFVNADEAQAAAKQRAGRYTLEEAANALEQNTGERADVMLKKLMVAAERGELPVYARGENARYLYGPGYASCVREFYEEARWNELNDWLRKNEPYIKWSFPTSPDSGIEAADFPPQSWTFSQEESKEQRQARRYQMCVDAKLDMPDNDYATLPRGIGELAKREGISRQAFSEDVKAHIARMSERRKQSSNSR